MSNEYRDFENVEDLWFWFCRSIEARALGLRGRNDEYLGYVRKCELSDIERILKRLKAGGYITNRHLRVMARWGKVQIPPYYQAKRSEIRLWEEAMLALENILRIKGILP